jgi:cell division protein DivIC
MNLEIQQKWLKFKYMKFVEIVNKRKFTLISILMFFYVFLNLLDGERGLISYYEKQEIIKQLFQKEKLITSKLNLVEKKNRLLTEVIDTDYLEILYRKKFMVGKSNEHIYKNN